jgi:hypothetical protein
MSKQTGRPAAARRWLLGAGLLLVVAAALVALCAVPIRARMRSWTGEEDLRQQVKGSLALAYLTLTHPAPRTSPYAPLQHAGLSPYGVNTFLEQEAEPEKVERTLALIAEAGFHWVRQEFPWEDIEISAKGDFWDHKWDQDAWAKYDRIVEAADRHGLEIIARLDNPPAWSRAVGNAPGWEKGPPDDYADYGDFVYTLVSRYRGRLRYYQIWNEPNIFPEWGDQAVDAAAYTELLRIAYLRAKEADPDCVIVAAGLAQTIEQGPRNLSDLTYLEGMYAAGAGAYFDVMGAQTYGLWTGPQDQRLGARRTNFSRVQLLREAMVRHGDAHKPIWATEVGWNAAPTDLAEFPYGRVTEQRQAEYTVAAYRRAQAEWPWLGVMNYWFFRRPSDAEREQAWYYFRMLEPDFTPLPVYGAMASLARGAPTLSLGYHQEDHWALDYAGPWEHREDSAAVLGGYALGSQGATVVFDYWGSDLAVVLRDAAEASRLTATIDGRAAPLRPAPRGLPVDATAVGVGERLPYGRHTAVLTATGGEVGLDAIIAWRRPFPWIAWLGGGLAVLLLAAGALGFRARGARHHG